MYALSERQRLLTLQDHARHEDSQLLDVFNCVEQLHAADMGKVVAFERGEFKISKVPRPGRPPSKVSFAKLAAALPRHVMACLLAKQPAVPADDATAALTDCPILSTSCYDHVAKALTLLANLADLASQHRLLREAVLHSPDWASQLVDAANLALLAVAGPEAERCIAAAGDDDPVRDALDRAALASAALRALALGFTGSGESGGGLPPPADGGAVDWGAVAERLLAHPRGAVLLDAGFDAVRVVVLAVRAALVGSTHGDAVYRLAYHAGAAMECLSCLCVTPLFYHRLLLHDPSGAAPLRLVLACLTLHDAPLAAPPFSRSASPASSTAAVKLVAVQPPYTTDKGKGAAELLVARGFALLLMLAECEEPSYMDSAARHPGTRRLSEHIVNRAAAYIGQVLLRPPATQYPAALGEGQMAINTLRAAELLSDDSNFRGSLIPLLAPTLAGLLSQARRARPRAARVVVRLSSPASSLAPAALLAALPCARADPASFRSRWCAGPEAVKYHESDDILVNSLSAYSLYGVQQYAVASQALLNPRKAKLRPEVKMGQHLALERATLLAKLVVNLHYYAEGRCAPQLKDAFVRRLLELLAVGGATRVVLALQNLKQLFGLLAPFAPPLASEEQELLKEIDTELYRDLLVKLQGAIAPAVAQLQAPRSAPGAAGAPAVPPRPAPPIGNPPYNASPCICYRSGLHDGGNIQPGTGVKQLTHLYLSGMFGPGTWLAPETETSAVAALPRLETIRWRADPAPPLALRPGPRLTVLAMLAAAGCLEHLGVSDIPASSFLKADSSDDECDYEMNLDENPTPLTARLEPQLALLRWVAGHDPGGLVPPAQLSVGLSEVTAAAADVAGSDAPLAVPLVEASRLLINRLQAHIVDPDGRSVSYLHGREIDYTHPNPYA
eukprot:scaffold3.g6281.t1